MRIKLTNREYEYLVENYPCWDDIKDELSIVNKKNPYFIVIILNDDKVWQIYKWAKMNVYCVGLEDNDELNAEGKLLENIIDAFEKTVMN